MYILRRFSRAEQENQRGYRATGAFNLAFILTAAAGGESRSGKYGCAGAQHRLYTAISLRFERRLIA